MIKKNKILLQKIKISVKFDPIDHTFEDTGCRKKLVVENKKDKTQLSGIKEITIFIHFRSV